METEGGDVRERENERRAGIEIFNKLMRCVG